VSFRTAQDRAEKTNSSPVSEVIALKLRRPGAANEYLYVQIYAGISCVVASMCLLELWRVKRRAFKAII